MIIKLVLRKIGDSAGFYLPAFVIKSLGLEIGKEVKVALGEDVREVERYPVYEKSVESDREPEEPEKPFVAKSYMCPKHKVARVSCGCK